MWTASATVVLLTCLFVVCNAAAPKCPESELAEIEYNVKSCQKQAEARFFLNPDSVRLCQLLVEVLKQNNISDTIYKLTPLFLHRLWTAVLGGTRSATPTL